MFLKSLFLIAVCIFASFSQADKLRVGVEKTGFYPYFSMKKGQYRGFSRDLFDMYSAASGSAITYTAVSVSKLTDDLVKGKVEFKFPDNASWAQDKKAAAKVIYSRPVVEFTDGMMVLKSNKGTALDQLRTIGTIRGFTPYPLLDHIKSGKITLKEYSHSPIMIKRLVAGEVDAIYVNIQVANYIIQKQMEGSAEVVFDSGLPHVKDNYHLSTISYPEVIKSFDAFLSSNQPQIQELKDKYGL